MAYSYNNWDKAQAGRVYPKPKSNSLGTIDKEHPLAHLPRKDRVMLLSAAMTEAITQHPLFQIAMLATKADNGMVLEALTETRSIAAEAFNEVEAMKAESLLNMEPKGLPS